MYFRGHVGLTLLTLSLLAYLFDFEGLRYVIMIIIASALSSLPDIDIRLEIPHRKYTHNIIFALIISLGSGYLTFKLFNDFSLGFTPMFAAFTMHIIGDLMTYRPFKPLAPFQRRATAFKLFRSSNPIINNGLLILGIIAFINYISYTLIGLNLFEITNRLVSFIMYLLGH